MSWLPRRLASEGRARHAHDPLDAQGRQVRAGGEVGRRRGQRDVAANRSGRDAAGREETLGRRRNHIKQWIDNGLPTVAERQKNDDPLLSANEKHAPKDVAAAIDRHLNMGLTSAKLKAAPRSDDAEFLRRVYIDLTGRVPTAEQAVAFLDSKDADKRAKLIDALLATPQFGEQLGRTWRDWICPPELPSDGNGGEQPHKEAQNLGKWIGERFAAGDSWDKITRDILAVDGEIKNKPQVIFFGLVGEGGKLTPDGSARAVASLFMGVQMQCAQCHDDPYRDWAQKDHWALAAFFSKVSGDFNKVSEGKATKTSSQITIPKSAFKNAGTDRASGVPGGQDLQPEQGRAIAAPLRRLADREGQSLLRPRVRQPHVVLLLRPRHREPGGRLPRVESAHPSRLDETAGQRVRGVGVRRQAPDPLHLQLGGVPAHQPGERRRR